MTKPLEFSEWLQKQLLARGWTQADLVRSSGVSKATISRLISGSRSIGHETAISIAEALVVPPEEVLRQAGLLPEKREDPPGLGEWIQRYLEASKTEREEMLEYARFKTRKKDANASELRRVGN